MNAKVGGEKQDSSTGWFGNKSLFQQMQSRFVLEARFRKAGVQSLDPNRLL